MECLFCKISKKEISSDIIFEDDLTICFKDISPVAKVHFLFIPKEHIDSVFKVNKDNSYIIARLFENIAKIGLEILPNGFRTVNNNGNDAMQSVNHVHFHIIGGNELGWPPC